MRSTALALNGCRGVLDRRPSQRNIITTDHSANVAGEESSAGTITINEARRILEPKTWAMLEGPGTTDMSIRRRCILEANLRRRANWLKNGSGLS